MPKKKKKKKRKFPKQKEVKPFFVDRGKSVKRYIKEQIADFPDGKWDDPPPMHFDTVDYQSSTTVDLERSLPSSTPPPPPTGRVNYQVDQFYLPLPLPNELLIDSLNEGELDRERLRQDFLLFCGYQLENIYYGRDIRDIRVKINTTPKKCQKCVFYSNNPYLKCAVNPSTPEDCSSFEPK